MYRNDNTCTCFKFLKIRDFRGAGCSSLSFIILQLSRELNTKMDYFDIEGSEHSPLIQEFTGSYYPSTVLPVMGADLS